MSELRETLNEGKIIRQRRPFSINDQPMLMIALRKSSFETFWGHLDEGDKELDSKTNRKLSAEWLELKRARFTKAERLKRLSKKYGVSQKQIRSAIQGAGLWYDRSKGKRPIDQPKETDDRVFKIPLGQSAQESIGTSEDTIVQVRGSPAVEHVAGCGSVFLQLWGWVILLGLLGLVMSGIGSMFS